MLFAMGCVSENIEEKTGNGSLGSIAVERYSDSVYQVLKAHRTAYAQLIIKRLALNHKVIKATESWKSEKALLLPAQMFRETAHLLRDADVDVDFSLLSLWPINRHNVPKSSAEKKGLEFVRKNPNLKYYDKEKIGPQTFFVGVYPDNAVSTACVSCHNTHIKSPKRNFALGDNMGAIVIRIPISGS